MRYSAEHEVTRRERRRAPDLEDAPDVGVGVFDREATLKRSAHCRLRLNRILGKIQHGVRAGRLPAIDGQFSSVTDPRDNRFDADVVWAAMPKFFGPELDLLLSRKPQCRRLHFPPL